MLKKKSFLERLTGSISLHDDEEDIVEEANEKTKKINLNGKNITDAKDKELIADKWESEAELTCDVYQTNTEIIVQTMVSGVSPDNLSITITRDMITIRGKREENKSINKDNYFIQELYWGSFARTISLPEEIDPEDSEAIEKHGLLIIKLPKINKNKETKLKIKSI